MAAIPAVFRADVLSGSLADLRASGFLAFPAPLAVAVLASSVAALLSVSSVDIPSSRLAAFPAGDLAAVLACDPAALVAGSVSHGL